MVNSKKMRAGISRLCIRNKAAGSKKDPAASLSAEKAVKKLSIRFFPIQEGIDRPDAGLVVLGAVNPYRIAAVKCII